MTGPIVACESGRERDITRLQKRKGEKGEKRMRKSNNGSWRYKRKGKAATKEGSILFMQRCLYRAAGNSHVISETRKGGTRGRMLNKILKYPFTSGNPRDSRWRNILISPVVHSGLPGEHQFSICGILLYALLSRPG